MKIRARERAEWGGARVGCVGYIEVMERRGGERDEDSPPTVSPPPPREGAYSGGGRSVRTRPPHLTLSHDAGAPRIGWREEKEDGSCNPAAPRGEGSELGKAGLDRPGLGGRNRGREEGGSGSGFGAAAVGWEAGLRGGLEFPGGGKGPPRVIILGGSGRQRGGRG